MRRLHVLPPLTALLIASAHAASPDTCAGLPRLSAVTPAGFCVGVIAEGIRSPRAVQPLPNGDLLVADMGGWQPDRGSVWRLRPTGAGYEKVQLFSKLDRPNSIVLGPDGRVYVGLVKRIARFDPSEAVPKLVDVIGGAAATAPLPGSGRHLLTAFLFDRERNLIVNIGSATDHCENASGAMAEPAQACAEGEGREPQGAIRRYAMRWPQGAVLGWENYALGLRNSMAMAVDRRDGALWQGENARDAIGAAMPSLKNDNDLPHDELNRISRGSHYGWPYCYDSGLPSPEYPKADCRRYRAPERLLPAHAAPLGMVFYTGKGFPTSFDNSLLLSFHGYRQHGHRIVALLPDAQGAPLGKLVDLVRRSEGKAATLGAPVDIKVGPNGDVYIADDHTGRILLLHYAAPASH
jgi:glucose/arabinose dehydrogenase